MFRDSPDNTGAGLGYRWQRRLMARKLKTYQTSQGFFDQAITAP
jgi:hypothetical protein